MKHLREFFIIGLASVWAVGCAPSDGRVAITGTLEVDNQPIEGANIAFIGGGGGIMTTASTDAEGKFSARVASGKNKVSVSKGETAGADEWAEMDEEETTMGTPDEVASLMENQPTSLIAPKFADPATSGLEFDISEGMQPLIISVTSK